MKQLPVPQVRMGPRGRILRRRGGEPSLAPYLFIAPLVIVFAVFLAGPILLALRNSMYAMQGSGLGFDGARKEVFVGIDNYLKAFGNPEFVAGSRNRLDTSVMKAVPGRIVAKGGAEGLRGFAVLDGGTRAESASGIAIKIEDGGGFDRAISAASVEALRQAGVLDPAALRALARYHRPVALDPRGEPVGEAVSDFQLAPVGELLG